MRILWGFRVTWAPPGDSVLVRQAEDGASKRARVGAVQSAEAKAQGLPRLPPGHTPNGGTALLHHCHLLVGGWFPSMQRTWAGARAERRSVSQGPRGEGCWLGGHLSGSVQPSAGQWDGLGACGRAPELWVLSRHPGLGFCLRMEGRPAVLWLERGAGASGVHVPPREHSGHKQPPVGPLASPWPLGLLQVP